MGRLDAILDAEIAAQPHHKTTAADKRAASAPESDADPSVAQAVAQTAASLVAALAEREPALFERARTDPQELDAAALRLHRLTGRAMAESVFRTALRDAVARA